MKKIIFIMMFMISFSASAEIIIELSNKKLPIFNMPILKDSESLYFIEDDPINKIKYIAHKSCFTFKIIGLTENKELFLNENDVKNLIETAQDYADIFCPTTNKIMFTVSSSMELEPNQILFKTSSIRQDKWIEEKEFRQNNVLQKAIEKTNKIKNKLEDKSPTQRLAYLLGVDKLDNLLKSSMDAFFENKKDINSMILINDIKAGYATSLHPIKADVYGLPEKVGYYLIKGEITSEKGKTDLFKNTIIVNSFIECRKKGCSDQYDIDNIIKKGKQ